MSVPVYFAAILAPLALVVVAVKLWGVRPNWREVGLGLVGSLILAWTFYACTVVFSKEGNHHRLPLVLWIGSWAMFGSVRPPIRTMFATIALVVWLGALLGQHWRLIQSHHYTDNPKWHSQIRRHRPPALNTGTARAEWHTWLTGLYRIE